MEQNKTTEVETVTLECRYFTSKIAKALPAFYFINEKKGENFKDQFTKIDFLSPEAKAKVSEFEKGLRHGQWVVITCDKDKDNIWKSKKTEKYNARIFIRDIVSIELVDEVKEDELF